MKKNIVIVLLSVFLLGLIMLYTKEKDERSKYETEMNEWKSIALQEQEIPTINNRANEFIQALTKGEHKKFLTGKALKEYNAALSEDFTEEHEHYNESDTQDINILITNSQVKEHGVVSKVLYQLHYKSIFDNEEKGIVDQRILTLIMTLNWLEDGEEYKIDQYKLTLLDDTMGLDLASQMEGSESNE